MEFKMTNNMVLEWMTPNPVTTSSNSTLPEAYWLMMNNKIRRLIVMDKDILVGIITLDDIRHAKPPTTLGFDFVRVSDQLCKMTISQIMTKKPKTIAANASLIDAAEMMMEKSISTLPVMDGNKLVGIITESDIFRAFVRSAKSQKA
jgi:acetoin utilization protein AcuB